jgi:hypothetical protein
MVVVIIVVVEILIIIVVVIVVGGGSDSSGKPSLLFGIFEGLGNLLPLRPCSMRGCFCPVYGQATQLQAVLYIRFAAA